MKHKFKIGDKVRHTIVKDFIDTIDRILYNSMYNKSKIVFADGSWDWEDKFVLLSKLEQALL